MAAASAVRRSIYLAQAAYPQRMKRIHVVGARPFLASSLQLMRSCVNEKVRNRVSILRTKNILLKRKKLERVQYLRKIFLAQVLNESRYR